MSDFKPSVLSVLMSATVVLSALQAPACHASEPARPQARAYAVATATIMPAVPFVPHGDALSPPMKEDIRDLADPEEAHQVDQADTKPIRAA